MQSIPHLGLPSSDTDTWFSRKQTKLVPCSMKSHKPLLYPKTYCGFSVPKVINIGLNVAEIFENITSVQGRSQKFVGRGIKVFFGGV